MPTITISSLPADQTSEAPERVVLDIYVRPEDWEGSFDVLEIWRSEQTDQGPYYELTADTWQPAKIPPDGGDPSAVVGPLADIVGKPLQLKVNEQTDLVVVFTGLETFSVTNLVKHFMATADVGYSGSPDAAYAQVKVEFLDTFAIGAPVQSRYRYTVDGGAHWSTPVDLVGSSSFVVHGVTWGLIIGGMGGVVMTGDYFTYQPVSSGTAGDPIHYSLAASQIQAQSQGLLRSYVDSSGELVVQTVEPGTGAALRVVGGDTAPLLGLPTQEPDSLVYGHDARVPLIHGQQLYTFIDLQGSAENYYKTRFRNTQTESLSEFSAPFSVKTTIGVSPARLIRGVLDLVDMAGIPLANRQVLIKSNYAGEMVEGMNLAGTSQGKLTDARGHVEFMLVRGVSITVAIHGTNLVRDITVPTDSALVSFNLLDPKIGTDDVFRVQVPELDYAVRRSL